jgi:hypothetical protein
VDLYDGETFLTTFAADLFRKDLLEAGVGNGNHGFFFPTPASLKDGRPHTVRALIAGTKTELRSSPKTVTLTGP